MKKILILLVFLIRSLVIQAQISEFLSIDSCYILANQQYPLAKQLGLIEKSKDYTVQNISKGYFPQFVISGQATYQSAVTQIPIDLPGLNIPTLSKDQYRIYGELSQTLFDGGLIRQQKNSVKSRSEMDKQNLAVQLYLLRDRINQIFFGSILFDEQLKQNELLQKNLESSIDKIKAALSAGAALKSTLDELEVELLQQKQNRTTLNSARKAYMEMLGLFIGRNLDETTTLKRPGEINITGEIHRPELKYYESQKTYNDIQNNVLTANTRPKVSLFFQGGYGRPTLNLLQNKFSTYYIGGLRINWIFSAFYTLRNERGLLNINKQIIDLQKETFFLNTRIALSQQGSTISQLKELLTNDNEIISKRSEIKNVSAAQLEKGIITVHEYISQLNSENLARQNFIFHQVQLIMAQYGYKTISGN